MSSSFNKNFIENDRGGTRYNPGIARLLRTKVELETIEELGLTTNNMLTDNSGRSVITLNDGQILYNGTIE